MVFILMILSGCARHTPSALYAPPSLLPSTVPQMKTAGYWISRHSAPDKIILTPEQIKALNQSIRNQMKLSWDLVLWPAYYSGEQIRQDLKEQLEGLKKARLMQLDGTSVPDSYWDSITKNVNPETVPEKIKRQYGFVVRYANQRLLPTADGLFAKAHDVDFDELQNSALDIGTPVVILHTSLDGQWVYVQAALSSGWLKKQDVGAAGKDDFERMSSKPFVVMIDPKVDVFLNSAMTSHKGYLRMGARLPFIKEYDGITEVLVPDMDSDGKTVLVPGYIMTQQVNKGYLLYTPRMMMIQAFKMLNQPYGWGGMYGEQDCSRFLQEIFATVGIRLPRNSSAQIQIGERLNDWPDQAADSEKLSLLKESGIGGVTVLGMKGHIMLYLGMVDDQAYAIHAAWAYRQPGESGDDIFVLNKVTVSSLNLGEGSKRGSLLKRLNAVRLIGDTR
ncbi:MAG: SH3 domain-containing protein [Candidatus Omnitrophota bacterium]